MPNSNQQIPSSLLRLRMNKIILDQQWLLCIEAHDEQLSYEELLAEQGIDLSDQSNRAISSFYSQIQKFSY